MEEYMTRIARGTCDTCTNVGPIVILGAADQELLTQCKSCDPYHFEKAARAQVDRWLSGAKSTEL